MLVTYPFAFLTGGWGFGMAGAIWRRDELKTVSRYLVPTGVAAGLLAAVPGIIDYRNSVPPESSAKERATKHAIVNTAALALFTAGWLLGRDRAARRCRSRCRRSGPPRFRRRLARRHARVPQPDRRRSPLRERGQMAGRDAAIPSASPHVGGRPLGVNQMKLVHVDEERIVVARTERGPRLPGSLYAPGRTAVGRRADLRYRAVPVARLAVRRRTGAVKCGPAEQKSRRTRLSRRTCRSKSARNATSGGARRPPGWFRP